MKTIKYLISSVILGAIFLFEDAIEGDLCN